MADYGSSRFFSLDQGCKRDQSDLVRAQGISRSPCKPRDSAPVKQGSLGPSHSPGRGFFLWAALFSFRLGSNATLGVASSRTQHTRRQKFHALGVAFHPVSLCKLSRKISYERSSLWDATSQFTMFCDWAPLGPAVVVNESAIKAATTMSSKPHTTPRKKRIRNLHLS